MVAFSSILAVSTLIASTLAAPLRSSELDRRALPVGITVETARSYLSQLTVDTPSNSPAYKRSYFKLWDTISGHCNTRKVVLIRDGTNVVTDDNCAIVSGSWVSPYDDISITSARGLDIDHLVPLKEAWISGARNWTPDRREQFANELTQPQLVAVTHAINEAKGDKNPANWLPPVDSYKCTYVLAWIQVKYNYGLTVDSNEQAALGSTLDNYC
ncbi:hypothetical protein BDM02DRAFT_390108 [Thelephora ganbajun]|uniref:Uncharacterized protein n=1 Tax=Thelephora ganbajun TaxID=370292 RepID=A0ACB6Z8H4_THEGA|nr:hypothetical protein BDM02DRAFT_390108 [Thelephora ganbajun]